MNPYSVLMSFYKNDLPNDLHRAINSILLQTLPPEQFIIIQDGPVSLELTNVCSKFESEFPGLFEMIILPENLGLGKALQAGLRNCRNELVARMDADDISLPNRMELQCEYLNQNKGICVVGSYIAEFETSPDTIERFRTVPTNSEATRRVAVYRNPLNHQTVMFRRDQVLAAGGYLDMPGFEDYYLWVRLLLRGEKIENIALPLVKAKTNNLIERRHGVAYIKNEINFIKTLNRLNFINLLTSILLICSRSVIRALPKKLSTIIYYQLLREQKSSSDSVSL